MKSIEDLLNAPEDEYHDFKAQWYSENDKAELIKDIFSFVNTAHHQDCYLVMGVDDDHHIVGIENDEHRLNTQQLTNYLHSLPIANEHTPKVKVVSMKLDKHTIDIIIIKDTSDVPVYLTSDKRPKNAKRPIHGGQIFVRENDTNTAINESASDYLVERLWKKRFGLDLPIEQRYITKLNDVQNWEYLETDKFGLLYTIDPDYCMYFEEDDEHRYRAESYSLGQFRAIMSWYQLVLKYRSRTIATFLVVSMDGARFMTLTPNLSAIDPLSRAPITFQYFLADSLEFAVEKLFLSTNQGAIAPDAVQRLHLLERIVVFDNEKQKDKVIEALSQQTKNIKQQCTPSKEELKLCQAILSMDFNDKDTEMAPDNIKHMCQEAKVSQFIHDYVKTL